MAGKVTKIDIFEILGLRVAEREYAAGQANTASITGDAYGLNWVKGVTTYVSRQKRKGSDTPIPSFMQIHLRTSSLLGARSEGDYTIFLPYDHEKTVQDTIQTRIENNFKASGFIGSIVAQGAQATAKLLSKGSSDFRSFLANNILFKYDAGSTTKTLQIPFVVPLGLATMQKLQNGAAKKVRKCFNTLQGLLYPQGSTTFFPPLMELTMGGLYRSFYGFVTAVTISPTNPDMFQDPESGEFFHLLYNGSITFQNLFTYYHDSIPQSTEGDSFKIDRSDVEVLFGSDSLNTKLLTYTASKNGSTAYMSDETAKAVDNILFTEHYNESSAISLRSSTATVTNSAPDSTVVPSVLPYRFKDDIAMRTLQASINTVSLTSSVYASKTKKLNTELAVIEQEYNNELSRRGKMTDAEADALYSEFAQRARNTMYKYLNEFR